MGDMGDAFRELTKARKEKRNLNLKRSTQLLECLNIPFVKHNAGFHLVVSYGGKVVDFYPSTGLWVDRENKNIKRRGVRGLLVYIGAAQEKRNGKN